MDFDGPTKNYINKEEKKRTHKQIPHITNQHCRVRALEVMGKQVRDQLGTGAAHKHPTANTSRSRTRRLKTYLNVGSETLALLPLDGQAELLAHLADLRSALSKVNPCRLALLSLLHISCQVVQQL